MEKSFRSIQQLQSQSAFSRLRSRGQVLRWKLQRIGALTRRHYVNLFVGATLGPWTWHCHEVRSFYVGIWSRWFHSTMNGSGPGMSFLTYKHSNRFPLVGHTTIYSHLLGLFPANVENMLSLSLSLSLALRLYVIYVIYIYIYIYIYIRVWLYMHHYMCACALWRSEKNCIQNDCETLNWAAGLPDHIKNLEILLRSAGSLAAAWCDKKYRLRLPAVSWWPCGPIRH